MTEIYLRVYLDRSELVHPDGTVEVFSEGIMDASARERYLAIHQALAAGFLEQQILLCRDHAESQEFDRLLSHQQQMLDKLIAAITSEVGRTLVALLILQLAIKTIMPAQNIRLHKGSKHAKDFSWQQGISMRTLDKAYITPILRKYDLIKLNVDGFMMTRSLAENYPYSLLYKANFRGAREQWLLLVEELESNSLEAIVALRYLLARLLNAAVVFRLLAQHALTMLDLFLQKIHNDRQQITILIAQHIQRSGHAARLMEIAMHSLMQAVQATGALLAWELVPLGQMRSANKKHGNIADIELMHDGIIMEAWDAKYGKDYLRDELEELNDKLLIHPDVLTIGFVTNEEPQYLEELAVRMTEIEELQGVTLQLLSFDAWIAQQFKRVTENSQTTEPQLAQQWLHAYVESIAQLRRHSAPIDEPCQHWLELLVTMLENATV